MSRVQYGIWPNCCNACDFCLNLREAFYSKEEQISMINNVIENIKDLDWVNTYRHGISLLGGEIYFITDPDIQEAFLNLIDVIINEILLKVNDPMCKYSTVTNGLYNPDFLVKVLKKFEEKNLFESVDLNFSYDLKYRYSTEERRLMCESTIKTIRETYPDLKINAQMIVTHYLVKLYKENNNILNEIHDRLGVNRLNLLFPHQIHTGKTLEDFYLHRKDFLEFLMLLKQTNPDMALQFVDSIISVDRESYIGLYRRNQVEKNNIDTHQPPMREDVKLQINPKCGHSVLYQCYEDSDKCLFCDIRKYSC